MDLKPYLEDIERRIDEAQEEAIYDAWQRFADGQNEDGPFVPPARRPSESAVTWEPVNVNDALEDDDVMVYSQLWRCHSALSEGSGMPMVVRANYGVGNIASMFGAKPFIMPYHLNTLPNVHAVGEEGVRRILDASDPELTAGNGAKIMAIGERFAEIRRTYPKLGRFVCFEQPDAQGPMDNCELLWGSELFYSLYDEPELVHGLLRRMTDAVRRLLEAWYALLPNERGLASYFGRMSRGGIVIRDDSAMNLSPEFFDEFIAPYDGELLAHFGGGTVHFCGRGDHFVRRLAQIPGLSAVDMSQPHLNDMEKILSALPDQGVRLFCPAADYSLAGHSAARVFYS